jgi:hypothetical protein
MILNMNEKLIEKAYQIYLEEGRKEYDELVSSGSLVNYREFPYQTFKDAGTNPKNIRHSSFVNKFNYYIEKAKIETREELISKLLQASKEIDRTPRANYIHLSDEFIQNKADEIGVSFDEMIEIIENELKFKQ